MVASGGKKGDKTELVRSVRNDKGLGITFYPEQNCFIKYVCRLLERIMP